jgi:hypothetical protein
VNHSGERVTAERHHQGPARQTVHRRYANPVQALIQRFWGGGGRSRPSACRAFPLWAKINDFAPKHLDGANHERCGGGLIACAMITSPSQGTVLYVVRGTCSFGSMRPLLASSSVEGVGGIEGIEGIQTMSLITIHYSQSWRYSTRVISDPTPHHRSKKQKLKWISSEECNFGTELITAPGHA